jgi:hypothetical protein
MNRQFIPQPIALSQQQTEQKSGTGFALLVILCAFGMIVGGLVYMLTKNTSDLELVKSLVK